MTKTLILLAIASILMACSSGSSPSNPAAAPGPAANKAAKDSDFDKMSVGIWASKNCMQSQNGTASGHLMFQFLGDGKGKQFSRMYPNTTCTGPAQDQPAVDFTFTVDNYANGGGQITIQDKQYDLSFTADGQNMTVSGVSGSLDLVRSN